MGSKTDKPVDFLGVVVVVMGSIVVKPCDSHLELVSSNRPGQVLGQHKPGSIAPVPCEALSPASASAAEVNQRFSPTQSRLM